jgi:hypothetical protein
LQTTAGKMIFGKFDERALTMPRPVEHRNDVRKSGATPAAVVPESAKPE